MEVGVPPQIGDTFWDATPDLGVTRYKITHINFIIN